MSLQLVRMPDALQSRSQPIRFKLLECGGAHRADGATRTLSSLGASIRRRLVLDGRSDLAFAISPGRPLLGAGEGDEGDEACEGDEGDEDEGSEGNEGDEGSEGDEGNEDEGSEGNDGDEGSEGDEDEGDAQCSLMLRYWT